MAVKWIALWGIVAIATAIAAAIMAGVKNRNHSSWAAWCFIFPPLIVVLLLLPTYKGILPRRKTFDEEDNERETA